MSPRTFATANSNSGASPTHRNDNSQASMTAKMKACAVNATRPSGRVFCGWRMILLLLAAGLLFWPTPMRSQVLETGTRNIANFPGPSIVERIEAAIRDCASGPCEVYIPAGTYNSSPIPSWKHRDVTGARVGVAIPSNVEIRGAGRGLTIIRVTRSATQASRTRTFASGT